MNFTVNTPISKCVIPTKKSKISCIHEENQRLGFRLFFRQSDSNGNAIKQSKQLTKIGKKCLYFFN